MLDEMQAIVDKYYHDFTIDDVVNMRNMINTEVDQYQKELDKRPKLITGSEYMQLNNPTFISQTRADDNGDYEMHFECDNKKYFTKNNLFV
jgi:hypothetical protein